MPRSGVCLNCGLRHDVQGESGGLADEGRDYCAQLQALRQRMGSDVDETFRQELAGWTRVLGLRGDESAEEG